MTFEKITKCNTLLNNNFKLVWKTGFAQNRILTIYYRVQVQKKNIYNTTNSPRSAGIQEYNILVVDYSHTKYDFSCGFTIFRSISYYGEHQIIK